MNPIILPLFLACFIISSQALTSTSKPVLGPEMEIVPIIEVQQSPKISSYLGQTYNPFKGNPLSSVDPGFTGKNLFEFTELTKATKDGNFIIPQDLVEFNTLSMVKAESNIYSGLSGYYNELSSSISYIGGLEGSQNYWFTKSADFQAMEKSFKLNNVVSFVKFKCSLYSLAIKRYQSLSKNFLSAVADALKSGDWKSFINNWGVYYTTQVFYGATAVQKTEFARKDAQDLLSLDFTLEDIAKAFLNDFEPVTLTSAKSKIPKTLKFYFGKTAKTVSAYNIGEVPPKKTITDWIANAAKAPAPVSYQLGYIGDLFSMRYLGQFYDDKTLTQMKSDFENQIRSLFMNANSLPVPSSDIVVNPTKILQSRTPTFGGVDNEYNEIIPPTNNVYQRLTKITISVDTERVLGIGVEFDDGLNKRLWESGNMQYPVSEFIVPVGRSLKNVVAVYSQGYEKGRDTMGIQFILDDGTKSKFYGNKYGSSQTLTIEGMACGIIGRLDINNCHNLNSIGFISNVLSYDGNSYATYATANFGYNEGSWFSWVSDNYADADSFTVKKDKNGINGISMTVDGVSSGVLGNSKGKDMTVKLKPGLTGITFNIYDWVNAFTFCYGKKDCVVAGTPIPQTSDLYLESPDPLAKLVGIYGKFNGHFTNIGFIYRIKG